MKKVAPLQVYSSYSLLLSPIKIEELVQTAAERGYQTVVLTDLNNLYGAANFFQAAKTYDINPVIGLTISLDNQQAIFLAKDQVGYMQLVKLSSKKMTEEFENFDQLTANLELNNLIAITDVTDLKAKILDFYTPEQVGLTSVKYLNPEDGYLIDILSAISENQKISIEEIKTNANQTEFLDTYDNYINKLTPQQLKTQDDIFNKITDFQINFNNQVELPKFDVSKDSNSYLWELIQKGMTTRLKNKNVNQQIYQDRLKSEFEVISKLNFTDYFLIVWDILNYAHHNNIQTGPGRGSAAGSLIAYALYITEIDPIKYGLLFERFLNDERIELPDIDIDVPDIDRQKIIKYIIEKYGKTKTAQIITFSTLSGRQVLRDVARVFNADSKTLTLLSSLFNGDVNNIQQLDLKTVNSKLQSIENGVEIFEIAEKLEGLPRQFSVHAAGVVISSKDLVETIPVQKGAENLLTQVTKKYVEKFGLLKVDILGLRNLTLLANILESIKQTTGQKINVNKIDTDDQLTIELFKRADTDYIFQFESNGIRNFLKRVNVDNFSQIVDVNAMYRPGPMQNIDTYVNRKKGEEQIDYLDQRLKKILEPTFGIIVYQEQAMLIAETMAGFTLGQADLLRSAIGKKNSEQMQQLQTKFIEGSIKNNFTHELAVKVFDFIQRFAGYGFNRSHAVAYSSMSFALAYLKTHYPINFFAAVLMQELGNQDKIKNILVMMKRYGVQLSLPDVNVSGLSFEIADNKIIYGLQGIKNIRTDFAQAIVDERIANGNYSSLQNFISRLESKYVKVEFLEHLTLSGALDNFGYNRQEIMTNLERLISGAELGDEILKSTTLTKTDEFTKLQLINYENSYLGVSLSGSPLEQFDDLAKKQATTNINQLQIGIEQKILVMITAIKVIKTKNNQEMAFLTVSDDSGESSVTVFTNSYQKNINLIQTGVVMIIEGELQKHNNQLSFVAKDLKKIGVVS